MGTTTGIRSFFSWGTLISGFLAVLLWRTEWNWQAGAWFVLLLYIHEIGHVLAALWRRVPVRRAPFFLPGFGAFVLTSPTANVWDRFWVSLGGPVIGATAALAAKWAGGALHQPNLAFAGHLMLWINLLNLAPFGMLDGGQVVGLTGWLGLVPAAFLGGYLLSSDLGPVLSAIIIGGLVLQLRNRRQVVDSTWGTRLAVLGLYLVSLLALLLTASLTGKVAALPTARPSWAPGPEQIVLLYIALWMGSSYILRRLWRPESRRPSRYMTAALAGWPQYLMTRPKLIGVMCCLGAQVIGMPGLAWLRQLIRRYSAEGDSFAGSAAAYAYDCLQCQGRPGDADEWLAEQRPVLRLSGPEAFANASAVLSFLGYRQTALDLLGECLDQESPLPSLPANEANTLAWCLLVLGKPQAALPLAEQAVAAEPNNFAHVDTLGQVRLALGDATSAEADLRRALALHRRPGTQVALARALAAQGRYADAVQFATKALQRKQEFWPPDEPQPHEVRGWVEEWQSQPDAAAAAVPIPKPGTSYKAALPALSLVLACAAGLGLGIWQNVRPTADLPLRVETPHAVFMGDPAMSQADLQKYADLFEKTVSPAVATDTGLVPTRRKLTVEVYGSQNGWTKKQLEITNAVYRSSTHRMYIAHWRQGLQMRSLTEVYLYWLIREEARADLPRWFAHGFAVNESWRIAESAQDWNTTFLKQQWQFVSQPNRLGPVPELAAYQKSDAFIYTAFGQLMQKNGAQALQTFFRRASGGGSFDSAFRSAFGEAPGEYQAEYDRAVSSARSQK